MGVGGGGHTGKLSKISHNLESSTISDFLTFLFKCFFFFHPYRTWRSLLRESQWEGGGDGAPREFFWFDLSERPHFGHC